MANANHFQVPTQRKTTTTTIPWWHGDEAIRELDKLIKIDKLDSSNLTQLRAAQGQGEKQSPLCPHVLYVPLLLPSGARYLNRKSGCSLIYQDKIKMNIY
jgi:hypothetical protein